MSWKPTKEHNEKVRSIELLQKYSEWLEKHGYTDSDWRSEEPYAIDEFIDELGNET